MCSSKTSIQLLSTRIAMVHTQYERPSNNVTYIDVRKVAMVTFCDFKENYCGESTQFTQLGKTLTIVD